MIPILKCVKTITHRCFRRMQIGFPRKKRLCIFINDNLNISFNDSDAKQLISIPFKSISDETTSDESDA